MREPRVSYLTLASRSPLHVRVTNIQFPPNMRAEVVGVARGLVPILRGQQGFAGLNVLTDPSGGNIVSVWEIEADTRPLLHRA